MLTKTMRQHHTLTRLTESPEKLKSSRKNEIAKHKKNTLVELNPTTLTITLNINGLNIPVKG